MVSSINTNSGAMAALQSLNNTMSGLSTMQNRVSAGMKMTDAAGGGATLAVDQRLRQTSMSAALNSNTQSLAKAKGAVETGVAATEVISRRLQGIRDVATRLSDTSLDSTRRTQLQDQYKSLVADIGKTIDNASFGGVNALGSDRQTIDLVAGGNRQIGGFDLKTKLAMPAELDSAAAAQAFLGQTPATGAASGSPDGGMKFADAERALGTVMNDLATTSRQISTQLNFNGSMQSAMSSGLGAIVDADLAREGANLQALQVRQQLGAQTLGIANQAPQSLMSLFR